MQTIKRAKQKSHFTQIPNGTARDAGLSIKALGLLTFILSYPDDWIFHLEWIATQRDDGKHAIREAMRELEAGGYAKKVIERDTKTGRVVRKYWTFCDSVCPTSDFPKKEESYVGKPAATNNVLTNNVGNEGFMGAFQPKRDFPVDEDSMMETIENEIGYTLTGQADTIARNFYYDMEKAGWTIKGTTVIDWLKVLAARIEKQTGENILSGYEKEDVAF